MKKHLALLLCCTLSAATLASCGSATVDETTEQTTPAEAVTETEIETEPELTDSLPPDLTFDGMSVDFLTDAYNELYSPIFVEDQTGDVLNDARYETELYVEDRLNITIAETIPAADPFATDGEIKNLITSGDTTYEIMSNMDRFIINGTLNGYFYATSDVPNLDLSAPYWNPKTTSRFLVGEKTFFTMNSFSMFSFANTNAILMNLDLATDLGMPDLYEIVLSGGWTYPKMEEFAITAAVDTNGDGEVDAGDQFGLIFSNPKSGWLNAVVGSACYDEIMHKDENNFFVYEISEKLVSAMEMFYNLYHATPHVYQKGTNPKDTDTLFFDTRLYMLSELREAEHEILVLPIPKFDEAQEDYHCRTYDTYFTMVPVTCSNLELTGATLEVLSCEAYKNLMPAYIDTTLTQKLVHNEESSALIQLILESRTISIAEAFLFDWWGDAVVFDSYFARGNASPASYIASKEKGVKNRIDKYNEFFSGEME